MVGALMILGPVYSVQQRFVDCIEVLRIVCVVVGISETTRKNSCRETVMYHCAAGIDRYKNCVD